MTSLLRVVIDQMIAPVPGGVGRYTEELTREIIATAPRGWSVEGIVSASTDSDYAYIAERLPGLTGLFKSILARRELSLSWQYGLTHLPGPQMVHSTSLLAPLYRHDRVHEPGHQTAVTIHDAVPWTHPQTLTRHGVSWHKMMAKRAQRYADAIVVPSHAVAADLREHIDFGDRVRVIGGAVSSKLVLPGDQDAAAARLGLPNDFILSVGTLEPRKGIEPLIRSLAHLSVDLPLVIVGPDGWGDVKVEDIVHEVGLDPNRVRTLGRVSDTDLALALSRAKVFVLPSLSEGFGLPLLEAMHFGTPVVHSDAPALIEVAGGAGSVVPLADPAAYPERLASAISRVVTDDELAARLGVLGRDRSKAFSWRDSAEKVWQLHADL
ncbi:glycosyltransferase family 1 protein [Diaminobutyricimonas sp. TR449]|uniref:glycosyltransferase family 4 protein n=1 Tax=Diaminobutyricimonas sp. TR449 TaxID=2708076 RepID=UPI00141DFEE3|nr:glycosyltransferase family 1 protein [Diaminobutyricimonas sp. TR449]